MPHQVPSSEPAGKPRVLFLNRSYWPDAEATGQLLTELCEDLASDFDVHVVAGQPNQNPTGETFARSGTEVRNGVTIHRVTHPQLAKRNMAGRALNLVAFLWAAARRAPSVPDVDLVVAETDPFLLALLGQRLKTRTGARLIAYVQDLYPDIAVALGKVREGWLTRAIRGRMLAAYRQADQVVVLSADMRQRLIEWGVAADRITSIPNWVDTRTVFPIKSNNPFREQEGLGDRFVVMHSGNMGLSQQLTTTLDAMALVESPDLQLLLIGGGAEKHLLEDRARQQGLRNVRFLPYQPREALAASLSAADVHLISLHPEAHHCLMPSKLYGILASGTAVLVIAAEDSELARLVREHDVGLVVPPGDPSAVARALAWCETHREEIARQGARARRLAETQCDRRLQTAAFRRVLHEVLAGPVLEPSSESPLQSLGEIG